MSQYKNTDNAVWYFIGGLVAVVAILAMFSSGARAGLQGAEADANKDGCITVEERVAAWPELQFTVYDEAVSKGLVEQFYAQGLPKGDYGTVVSAVAKPPNGRLSVEVFASNGCAVSDNGTGTVMPEEFFSNLLRKVQSPI